MSDSVRPHSRKPTRLPRPWDSLGKNTGVGCHFLLQCMKVKSESKVAQPYGTLRDPMGCSLPGSSVHGIFQARVLEWVAIGESSPFYCFPLFLCIDRWRRLSYLSLLFFGTLHSNGYIFPFHLCLSLLFFSQLFVRPPQTTILSFCISFSWGWSWSLPAIQCYEPLSIVLQVLYPIKFLESICCFNCMYNHKGFDLG